MTKNNDDIRAKATKLLSKKGYGLILSNDIYHVYVMPWKFQSWYSNKDLDKILSYAKYTHSVKRGAGSNYWHY
jgi:hypothetical protein